MLILDDSHAELMRIAAAQVKARGAYTVVITDKPSLAQGRLASALDLEQACLKQDLPMKS